MREFRSQRFEEAGAFLDRAEDWLLTREAEHNLLLGLAARLRISSAGYAPPIYLATVEDAAGVVGCAFRTPPFKLGLTRMPPDAVAILLEDVAEVYDALPAVLGPPPEAQRFAALWAARMGVDVQAGMRQRIYQLDKVQAPARPAPGRLRPAEAADLDLVARWIQEFNDETGVAAIQDRSVLKERILRGALHLWEDGVPRALAGVAAETPHGARVGPVYTPLAWRGRGYATSATAALSRQILEGGKRFCFLYTDLANPTSNAIYQRIGYRAVCDVADYGFMPPFPNSPATLP